MSSKNRRRAQAQRPSAAINRRHGRTSGTSLGMLATRPLSRLLEHVDRAQGKLVLVGDHRQLPELGAGGSFRGLAVRTQAAYLVENRRQREAWERDALEALRQGRAGDALSLYKEHGRLVIGKDAERLRQRLVKDWWRASQRQPAVMIALRRDDVRDLNARARLAMRTAGRLGGAALALPGGSFSVGDAIVTKLNRLAAGVVNGERGTVVAIDAALAERSKSSSRGGESYWERTTWLPRPRVGDRHCSTVMRSPATLRKA